MINYDFLNLSPPEFENLSRDLIQEEFIITLETFTNGRDNGIDLRYSIVKNKEVIVQCKRYADYKSLLSNLKKEKPKVVSLNPTNYIICTTVGLTPYRKNQILKLFSPYITSTGNIFGKDDINNLLGKFPDIEKKHFKLWLSSTTILDKILHSKVYNQSNFEIETIKETINVYVNNESYYNAIDIIKENKYVIISGIPGIGKTTLARVLVFHYLANGFEDFIYLSDSINDGYTLYKEGRKQIFLFDDFLGTNFLENKLTNNEEQRIVKFIERISKSKDKLIIFTTREYILAQAKQKYDALNNPSLEFAKCVIDLSQYTKIVRAKILYNHLFFSNIPKEYLDNFLSTKAYLTIIHHKNYNPRIIQTITKDDFWKTINSSEFSNKFLEFIKYPESVWKHVFENQISKLSQIILVNLMSCGSPITLIDLKLVTQNFARLHNNKYGIIYSEIEFRKSIRELENTFLKIIKDKDNTFAVEYQNPSVQDFLVNYFKNLPDYISDILNCTLSFNQIFRVFSFTNDFLYSVDNRILLTKQDVNDIIQRIINEFDYFNSTNLKGSSYFWHKEKHSDYTKLNDIAINISFENYSDLKKFMISRIEQLVVDYNIDDFELESLVNLVETFQYDISFDSVLIINQSFDCVTDINDLEIFERLESVFLDYDNIIMDNESIKNKIYEILETQADNTEDDFEDMMKDLIAKAEKYSIDYSEIEKILEEKIERQSQNLDHYDWNEENTNTRNNDFISDMEISNIFESLLPDE